MKVEHKPVLLREVIEYLNPKTNQNFIDCTFGGGGHSAEILGRIGDGGRLLGIDADKGRVEEGKRQKAKGKDKDRLLLVNNNFKNLKSVYADNFPYSVDGILFDLGLSSIELADDERGFSFLSDGPLDMRFDQESQELTAGEILNKYVLEKLVKIFCDYGEVPRGISELVAKAVIQERKRRPLTTVFDFLTVILKVYYPGAWARGEITVETKNFYHRRKRINHPATQFFQAVRIEVNNELGSLYSALPQAVEILKSGGRVAVISFHSLEDRIVKNFFREQSRGEEPKLKLLTKKPIVPSAEERATNPRSRSAKMRVAEKI